jgi:hypothetical protein
MSWTNPTTYLTLEQFLILCPEFNDTDQELVRGVLWQTMNELDPDQWAGLLPNGHAMLTAHRLALSPAGQNARLMVQGAPGGSTTYWTQYTQMLLAVTSGGRVT